MRAAQGTSQNSANAITEVKLAVTKEFFLRISTGGPLAPGTVVQWAWRARWRARTVDFMQDPLGRAESFEPAFPGSVKR